MGMGRRHGWWVLVLFLAVVTIGAGSLWWQSRSVRHAIAEIEAEMAAGRHAIAARRLNQLLLGAFTNDQAAYLLGVCEQARGRTQAADQAWARVAPGSSFFSRAISDRLTLMLESGRFADGEKLIDEAANDPRVNPTALRILLAPAFIQQGRLDDAERLIEERWQHLHDTGEEASELAVNLARLTLEMRWRPVPVESVRASLDRAAALAPDDDRVWLGQANLALQTGAVDVAEQKLAACLRRRPDDSSVWQARVNWAMAANRTDAVRQAVAHLPASKLTEALSLRIRAWLAARQEDRSAERLALDRLVAADPGDLTALARLAKLAQQAGEPGRATELKLRQAEVGRMSDRFHRLFDRNQPIRDADEMGRLAEKLGHRFVAKVFLTLAAAEGLHPEAARRELQLLSQEPRHPEGAAKTLESAEAL